MNDSLDALPLDQQHLVRSVTSRLEPQFTGTFGPETIERFVLDSLDRLLPTTKITTYLPVLAERFAKERLRALARLEGAVPRGSTGRAVLVRAQRRALANGRRLVEAPCR